MIFKHGCLLHRIKQFFNCECLLSIKKISTQKSILITILIKVIFFSIQTPLRINIKTLQVFKKNYRGKRIRNQFNRRLRFKR